MSDLFTLPSGLECEHCYQVKYPADCGWYHCELCSTFICEDCVKGGLLGDPKAAVFCSERCREDWEDWD